MTEKILLRLIIQLITTYCLIHLYSGLKHEVATTSESFAIGTIVGIYADPLEVWKQLSNKDKGDHE